MLFPILVHLIIIFASNPLSTESFIGGRNGFEGVRQTCHQMLSITYRFKQEIQIANCRRRNFDKVPHYLDHSTKLLDLRSNSITMLSEDSFQNYPYLVLLYLDENKIVEITKNAFLPLVNLEVLTLRNNLITLAQHLVPSVAFLPLRRLRTLHLDHNPLGNVPDFYFSPLLALRQLLLNGSTGLELNPDSLARLYNLTTLDISNCNLSSLHRKMEYSLDNMTLNQLYIGKNPWICDCRMKWLVRWYKMQPKAVHTNSEIGLNVDQPMCAGPQSSIAGIKDMRNEPLFGKTSEIRNFACEPKSYQTEQEKLYNTPLLANEGENVTLTCSFESDPKGNTEWYKDGTRIGSNWKRFSSNQTTGIFFNAMLYIINVKAKDSASYRCVHFNARGQHYQIRQLHIKAIHNVMETVKMTMILLTVATFVGLFLVILIITVYCLYRRVAYGDSKKRRYSKSLVRGDLTSVDKELTIALNPTNLNDADGTPIALTHNAAYDTEKDSCLSSSSLIAERPSPQMSTNPNQLNCDKERNNSVGVNSELQIGNQDHQLLNYNLLPNSACPVHGLHRLTYSPCPLHGDTRVKTSSMLHHSPSKKNNEHMYNTFSLQRHALQSYKPCPLHSDVSRQYSTLSGAMMSNKASKVILPSHFKPASSITSTSTNEDLQVVGSKHICQKHSVSFAEPEQVDNQRQRPCSSCSSKNNVVVNLQVHNVVGNVASLI